MSRSFRKITSLVLSMVLAAMVFIPVSASAIAAGEKNLPERERITYRAVGREVSSDMRKSLAQYNITVNSNSLVEIVQRADAKGTQLCVTNVNGALIDKSVLMAVDDDGEYKNFTAEDVAAAAVGTLSGRNYKTNLFGDGLQLVFGVSYYASPDKVYPSVTERYIQPQSALFVYYDPKNEYTVSRIRIDYQVYGDEGYFDGNTFTTITEGGSGHHYSIVKDVSNPSPSTYYSQSKPISSNRAIRVPIQAASSHWIDLKFVGVRKNGNKSIDIWDDFDLPPK